MQEKGLAGRLVIELLLVKLQKHFSKLGFESSRPKPAAPLPATSPNRKCLDPKLVQNIAAAAFKIGGGPRWLHQSW